MNPEVYTLEGSSDLLGDILQNAVTSRASDIHIEPTADGVSVRFRIDGFLYPFQVYEKHTQDSVIARVKILAQLNTSEHRLPQDGHFEFKYQNATYNLRVSTLPTIYGENLVLRILNREEILIKLERLGFDRDQFELVQKMISSPSGMILTTGPTGSGKTTLLYSVIGGFNSQNKNIVTIEDPIELQMKNIRQTQVKEDIGLTFAKVMRSMVRQDPDVIMLGEIRDPETAGMAVQSALTGILVLSTFHTFDVPALATRFGEMNITSSVLAQSVLGVISTRLVRTICPHCKEKYELTDYDKRILEVIKIPSGIQSNFQKGRGCGVCKNRGYLGRTGIFEVVYFNEEVRSAIIEKRPASYIYQMLHRQGIKNLKISAIEKVFLGMTTFEEITRIVGVLL